LDSSSHDSNLKTGSKLDLPFWLVKSIYNDKFKFASIEIPKVYKNFYHEILKADANVVDLRKMGAYYYDFGRLLVGLADHDSSQTIAKILLWVD
jgi:GINS complex subunit 3